MLETNTLIILISIIVYGVVFFIQKSQISKQNELFNKYEKIFNIINIDEIEKYITLQKKAMELSINNREIELANSEAYVKSKIEKVQVILDSSKTNFEKSKEISKNIEDILDRTTIYVSKFSELNISEFEELHSTIKNILEKENPDLLKKIEAELVTIAKKYNTQKKDALEKAQISIQDKL